MLINLSTYINKMDTNVSRISGVLTSFDWLNSVHVSTEEYKCLKRKNDLKKMSEWRCGWDTFFCLLFFQETLSLWMKVYKILNKCKIFWCDIMYFYCILDDSFIMYMYLEFTVMGNTRKNSFVKFIQSTKAM